MNGFNAVKEARTCHSFTTGCPIEYPFSHLIWPDSRKLRELVMGKIVFVPLSDEMIYEHPELITGPIGTFAPGKVEFPDLEQAVGKGGHHLPKDKYQVGQIDRKMGWVSDLDRTDVRVSKRASS